MRKRAKYLLDTNILSYAVKADWSKPEDYPHWISRHLRVHQECCCLPSIAVEEITYGMYRNEIGQQRKAKLNRWLKQLEELPYDGEAGRIAGQLRADLARKGSTIGEYDVRIAAMARRYDLILVTHNVKHFSRIPNLRIEDWAEKPMSMAMFFRAYVSVSMQPIQHIAAILVALYAFFLTVQPTFASHLSQWLPTYFLNTVGISVIVGTVLALASQSVVMICLAINNK